MVVQLHSNLARYELFKFLVRSRHATDNFHRWAQKHLFVVNCLPPISDCLQFLEYSSRTDNMTDGDPASCQHIPPIWDAEVEVYEMSINESCLAPGIPHITLIITVKDVNSCEGIPVVYKKATPCSNTMYLCQVTRDSSEMNSTCQVKCDCPNTHDQCFFYIMSGFSQTAFSICHIHVKLV